MSNMNDQQDPALPSPEDGWMFAVPPPAKCNTGRLPYPLVVKGPITEDQQLPDKKRWQCSVTQYTVDHGSNEILEWVDSKEGEGLGAFGNGMLVLDNLWTISAGLYIYQVVISLLDKESGVVEQHAVVRSGHFSAEMDFDNSSIRLIYQAKEEARKAIMGSPIPERPKLVQRFQHYLH